MRIYDAYNATRPTTTQRKRKDWEIPILARLKSADIYIANPKGKKTAGAYAIVQSNDSASLTEVGCIPGCESLLEAAVVAGWKGAQSANLKKATMFGPFDPLGDKLAKLFIDDMKVENRESTMVRPLASRISMAEIEALFGAPGATFWNLDDF
jgi:hypothetical protein